MNRNEIEEKYWEFRLTRGVEFSNVFAFCREIGIAEAEFYESFASLEAIESEYWRGTVSRTVEILGADSDYASYDVEQKLLAFFYTYISVVQKHRSRLVECFPSVGGMRKLTKMRREFVVFAEKLIQEGVSIGEIADRKKLTSLYAPAMFEQLRVVLEFYKRDQSSGFEDTDAFIEKTVRLGMETAKTGVFEAGLDFARFIIGRLPEVR